MIGMTVTGFLSPHRAVAALPAGSDTFATAPEISSSKGISLPVNLTAFTSQAGEPSHNPSDDVGGGHSAWWSWTAQETGFCTVDTRRTFGTANAVRRTSLGVYVGTAVNDLTLVGASSRYSYNSMLPDYELSSVVFYAETGKTYYIAADAATESEITGTAFNVILQVRLVALKKSVRNAVWALIGENVLPDAGTLTVATTATGRFTGKLGTMKKTYSFTGVIGVDGYATLSFERPGKKGVPPQPPFTLMLDLVEDGRMVLLMDNLRAESVLPERMVFAQGSSSEAAGRMTALLDPDSMETGFGSLSMTVSSKGVVKGAGTALDGTAFTFSSAQHSVSEATFTYVPVHVKLKGNKGLLQLPMIIIENGEKDVLLSEQGFFVRHEATKAGDVFYPDGVGVALDVVGQTYLPGSGGRALGFLDGSNGSGNLQVTNFNGELPGNIAEPLTLSEKNKFTFNDLTRKPVLKLNVKTGLITGTILEPSNKKRNIRAVLFEYSGQIYVIGMATGTTVTLKLQVVGP